MKIANLSKNALLLMLVSLSLAACSSLQHVSKDQIYEVYSRYKDPTYQKLLQNDSVLQGISQQLTSLGLALAFGLSGDKEAPKATVDKLTDGMKLLDHADYLRRKANIAFDEDDWPLAEAYQELAKEALEKSAKLIASAKEELEVYWEKSKPKDQNMVF